MANPDEPQKTNKVTRRGLLLKETRESKGLSIETVHEMTKIPLDVMHAIEEGYTVRMVSAYYFKGFIKMYAKFLGLDPSLVLDEPMPEKPVADENEIVSVAKDPEHRKFNEYIVRQGKKQMIINMVVSGIIAVIVLIAFVVWSTHSNSNGEARPQPPKVKKESPLKKMIEKQNADRKIVEQTKPKPKAQPKVAKKDPVKAVAPVVETPAAEPIEEAPVESVKAATGKKVSLSIKSKAAGWLQVKVDGNLVFQSTLRAGTVESWQADKSIELSGKNINNLEFEVNGKVLGQLGKSDRGVRRVVITKDGLTVKN